MSQTDHQIESLAGALSRRLARFDGLPPDRLRRIIGPGVAHDHFEILEPDGAPGPWVLRVPRVSQFALRAAENLIYQAACFERASASGHVPCLRVRLDPGPDLPMGALLVDRVDGRLAELPGDLPAMAICLARVHALPVPPPEGRPPLQDHANPLAGTVAVIEDQARHAEAASGDADFLAMLESELAWARRMARALADRPQPVTLVLTDTHPANFMVERDGTAHFVDLEKALYGGPAIDIAHVSIPTSTLWALDLVLDRADIVGFHRAYLAALPAELADAIRPWLLVLRRLTWLRSTSWSCRWYVERVLSGADPDSDLAARLRRFWAPEVVARTRDEWAGADPLREDELG